MAKKPDGRNEGLSSTHPQFCPDKVNNFIKQRVTPKPMRHEFEAARKGGAKTNEEFVTAILAARSNSGIELRAELPPHKAAPELYQGAQAPAWLRDGFVMIPIRAYQELLAAAGR
jgi:hypothetical protein